MRLVNSSLALLVVGVLCAAVAVATELPDADGPAAAAAPPGPVGRLRVAAGRRAVQAATVVAAAGPAALFGVDALARAAADDGAAPRAAKPAIRAAADLLTAAVADSSCEASGGDGCGDGAFCNNPAGDGGACVTCPVAEEHCEDFGEAAGACARACFQVGADGAPALDVGTTLKQVNHFCPKGGCCTHRRYMGDRGDYACGCGFAQSVISKDDPKCFQKCGSYGANCDCFRSNRNTAGQLNLGHADSVTHCLAMVRAQCPDADFANLPESGSGSCWCQYEENYEPDNSGWQTCRAPDCFMSNRNTANQLNVGHAYSVTHCLDIVRKLCPYADFANLPESGSGSCWCQYGENDRPDYDSTWRTCRV